MLIDVQVGETVILHGRNRGAATAREATVVSVARVWITVDAGTGQLRFRRDTQTDGSDYGYPLRFYTLTQWAEKQQRDEAATFLHEQGIDLRYDSPWRGRESELADVIRKDVVPDHTEE